VDARNTILGAAITGILGVVLNNAFDEQTPACILAVTLKPLAGASCPDKAPVQIHDHRELGVIDGAGPAIGAANAIRQLMATSAQFPAAYYEETFVQPAHRNLMIITPAAGNPANQKELNSTKPEPSEPPHHEPQQELLPATVSIEDCGKLSNWFGPSLAGPRPNFRAGPVGSA
jgi:hypothetical protein